MNQIRRLHWGYESTALAGWINAGPDNWEGADIHCDIILDGLTLESNSVHCIASSHALQQFVVHDVLIALRELYRVLKPSGVLRLCLPDLDKAIDAYKTRQHNYLWCWDWETLSGNFITQLTNYGYARTLFTYEFLEELLQKAGFSRVNQVAYCQTTSPYPELVELDSRPDESLFVEAFKAEEQQISALSPGTPAQIHLSWTQEPSTSLTVVWHTPSAKNPAMVQYRQLGSENWNSISGTSKSSPGKGVLHQATFAKLLPATEYEYHVSSDEGVSPATSEVFRTRTAPPLGPTDFTFAFICDTGLIGRLDGNSTGTQQIIEEIVADEPLFILGGGDYAYANRDKRYNDLNDAIDAWFGQMQPAIARFPFMAQYGNHEIFLVERFRDWAPRFAHPEGFDQGKNYSFDVGNAHFTAVYVPGSVLSLDQLLWLDTDLQKARNRGTQWLIVYQHEPIYGHGHSHPAKPEVRRVLAPIFEKHRVDLHLSGHDQNYERTYPLLGVPNNPTPTTTSIDRYEAGKGVIYAKVSPCGKMSEVRNDFSRFTTEQQPFITLRDDTAHHYALVTVRGSRELEVNIYSVFGNGMPKKLLESFCLVASTSFPVKTSEL